MQEMTKRIKKVAKNIIERLPHSFKKFFYLTWHKIRNFSFIPVSSIKTSQIIASQEESKLKLIGFLKIHNESSRGNLVRVLTHMQKFCDEIVVCDCDSTDDSRDVAKKFTDHVLREPNDFKKEIFIKQKMLEYVLLLSPDWIVWLDADEVFDREGELNSIRRLCAYGEKKDIDAFSFLEYNLWNNKEQFRTDEFFLKGWFVRLWRNNGNLKFDVQEGLHQNQHPLGMRNIERSDIKVIHYGFSSSELIEEKYERYKKHGQEGFYLDRFKDEKGIKLSPVSTDWLPLSSLKISVVCLIYKSTKYANFVWDSFNRYTKEKNAEFLFIANDATEKVKKHLKENNLPHLIFENDDKEEYYLNRVYRAFNYGGFNAPGEIIVFVNSDMAFSHDWLENLLKNIKKDRIICSRLIESGKMITGKHGINKNFGQRQEEFNDNQFQKFSEKIKKPEIREGGLFMPCAINKDSFVRSGGYPIGNRKEDDGSETSGDYIFFYEKLKPMGISHFTSFDSIVYHIQEGEIDD